MKQKDTRPLLHIAQHRGNGAWYGVVRYPGGKVSKRYGAYRTERIAIESILATIGKEFREVRVLLDPAPKRVSWV